MQTATRPPLRRPYSPARRRASPAMIRACSAWLHRSSRQMRNGRSAAPVLASAISRSVSGPVVYTRIGTPRTVHSPISNGWPGAANRSISAARCEAAEEVVIARPLRAPAGEISDPAGELRRAFLQERGDALHGIRALPEPEHGERVEPARLPRGGGAEHRPHELPGKRYRDCRGVLGDLSGERPC